MESETNVLFLSVIQFDWWLRGSSVAQESFGNIKKNPVALLKVKCVKKKYDFYFNYEVTQSLANHNYCNLKIVVCSPSTMSVSLVHPLFIQFQKEMVVNLEKIFLENSITFMRS